MPFNFVKFTDPDSSFAARITVRQTGQLGFNAGAINRYKINDFAFCVLFFDEEQKVIGLQLVNEQTEGAIEIKKSESNTFVRGKSFCDRYGIDYSESHRFELKREEKENGLLYFELGKELTKEQATD